MRQPREPSQIESLTNRCESTARAIAGMTVGDDSALLALPQIVAAVGSQRSTKRRPHLQFEAHRELPEHATLTPDETCGDDDERSVLSRNLLPGLIGVTNATGCSTTSSRRCRTTSAEFSIVRSR